MELSSAEAVSTRFLGLTQRSVSEDLGCRRGEFSRKHYGSVELLISSDADGAIQRAGRFRVENGSSDENTGYTPGTWHRTDVHLENPEYYTRWYFKYFLGKGISVFVNCLNSCSMQKKKKKSIFEFKLFIGKGCY